MKKKKYRKKKRKKAPSKIKNAHGVRRQLKKKEKWRGNGKKEGAS